MLLPAVLVPLLYFLQRLKGGGSQTQDIAMAAMCVISSAIVFVIYKNFLANTSSAAVQSKTVASNITAGPLAKKTRIRNLLAVLVMMFPGIFLVLIYWLTGPLSYNERTDVIARILIMLILACGVFYSIRVYKERK
jgi:hypothetical protein